MLARHCPAVALGLLALGACASKGDLRRVEEQLVLSRAENMRADSARAVQLAQILETQRRTMDSLSSLARASSVSPSSALSSTRGESSSTLVHRIPPGPPLRPVVHSPRPTRCTKPV
jgi:hypothetical protein